MQSDKRFTKPHEPPRKLLLWFVCVRGSLSPKPKYTSVQTCEAALQAATLPAPMPELPDIVVYIEALEQRILAQTLERVQIASPFLLRTAAPPITTIEGHKVVELRRLGKRICIGLEGDL